MRAAGSTVEPGPVSALELDGRPVPPAADVGVAGQMNFAELLDGDGQRILQ